MRLNTTLESTMAVLLSAVLVSCSATRTTAPSRDDEFSRFVLVIRELSDGEASYAWQQASEFELSRYRYQSSAGAEGRHIVLVGNRQRDCDAELLECMRECMSRPLPRGFGHITSGGRGLGGKEEYCRGRCNQPYLDCKKLQELEPQEFTALDGALDWLKHHRESILVGSVVVIAGVVFIVVSAGAGVLVLAPAVLLTASGLDLGASSVAVSHEG